MFEVIFLIVVWLVVIVFVSYTLSNLFWIFNGDKSEYDKLPDEEDDDE